jgi:hypothetical protein
MLILPHEASPRGAAELSAFEQVCARPLCGTHGVRRSEGSLAHGAHPGRHRCQRHARPERRKPPDQPIHGGVSSSLVTRLDASCVGRCLAGAHGTSMAHARVCHRDPRPRLPTTGREALRERCTPARRLQDRRRVWRVLLASTHRARERTADGSRQARPRHLSPGQPCPQA